MYRLPKKALTCGFNYSGPNSPLAAPGSARPGRGAGAAPAEGSRPSGRPPASGPGNPAPPCCVSRSGDRVPVSGGGGDGVRNGRENASRPGGTGTDLAAPAPPVAAEPPPAEDPFAFTGPGTVAVPVTDSGAGTGRAARLAAPLRAVTGHALAVARRPYWQRPVQHLAGAALARPERDVSRHGLLLALPDAVPGAAALVPPGRHRRHHRGDRLRHRLPAGLAAAPRPRPV